MCFQNSGGNSLHPDKIMSMNFDTSCNLANYPFVKLTGTKSLPIHAVYERMILTGTTLKTRECIPISPKKLKGCSGNTKLDRKRPCRETEIRQRIIRKPQMNTRFLQNSRDDLVWHPRAVLIIEVHQRAVCEDERTVPSVWASWGAKRTRERAGCTLESIDARSRVRFPLSHRR